MTIKKEEEKEWKQRRETRRLRGKELSLVSWAETRRNNRKVRRAVLTYSSANLKRTGLVHHIKPFCASL